MTDLPTLTSLLERVEKATGPDRKLDGEIFAAFETYSYGDVIPAAGGMVVYAGPAPHAPGQGRFEVAPKYTSSLDAALALVNEMLPGWFWRAGHVPSTHWVNGIAYHCWCHLSRTHADHCERDDEATGWAHTVPTAMLSALLRALIAKKETADG